MDPVYTDRLFKINIRVKTYNEIKYLSPHKI